MARYIIISWIIMFLGLTLTSFAMYTETTSFTAPVYVLGCMLMIVPNLLWVHLANAFASERLDKPNQKIITVILICAFFAFFIVFSGISRILDSPINDIKPEISGAAMALFPLLAFATLITAYVLAARRIIDASEAPHVDRGIRIFGYAVGFFYIAIGMFFIASKLKKLRDHGA